MLNKIMNDFQRQFVIVYLATWAANHAHHDENILQYLPYDSARRAAEAALAGVAKKCAEEDQ